MKEITVVIEGVTYDVLYKNAQMGANLEFHVAVKKGSEFDFIVVNYELDDSRVIQVEDKHNDYLNQKVASKVYEDYKISK